MRLPHQFVQRQMHAMRVLLLLFRISWWKAPLLAGFVTALVPLIFYSFLHVPLPWGLLEPIAW